MSLCVLIIGCGNIAGGFDAARRDGDWPLSHAGAYRRDGRFRLAACVEPDRQVREDFMARWGVEQGFASLDEIPAGGRFDVISICSPTAFHAEALQAAIALQPRLIFCEKPVTGSAAQTLDLTRAFAGKGILLAVNHTRRWDPDIVRLKAEIAEGLWGPVRAITGTYNKGVLNNGSHMMDLLCHLFGDSIRLIAAGSPVHDFWPDDPSVPALLTTGTGVSVQLAAAHAADYALFEMEVVMARAVITMEDGGAHWRRRQVVESPHFKGYRALDRGECWTGAYLQAMAQAVANIHDAVDRGADLASTGQTAYAAQRLCETIRKAAGGLKERD